MEFSSQPCIVLLHFQCLFYWTFLLCSFGHILTLISYFVCLIEILLPFNELRSRWFSKCIVRLFAAMLKMPCPLKQSHNALDSHLDPISCTISNMANWCAFLMYPPKKRIEAEPMNLHDFGHWLLMISPGSINNVLLTTYAYCIMWMVHDWNMYTLWLLYFIINAPYRSNFVSIHDFLVSHWKNWPFSRGYFSSLGHSVVAIVVVERFKEQSLYGLSLGEPKVAFGGLTVPTCTAFLCAVDKTWIRPDWMNPTNPILNLSSKVI